MKEVTEEESAQLAALYEQAAEGETPTAVGSVPENLPDEVPDIEDPEDVVPVPEAGDMEESMEENASIEEPTADAPTEEASSEEVAGETSDDDETENRE